jgi:hypothetical protein
MTHTEIITYQGLPKGRTHRLRSRSSLAAWRAIQVFLRDCASDPKPRVLRLDLQKSEGETSDLDAAIRVLGLPNTGASGGQTEYNWLLDDARFEIAVNCLDSQRQGHGSPWQPRMQCFCSYDFHLKDPDTDRPLQNQGTGNYLNFEVDGEHLLGQCSLRAWLNDESRSLYIFLSFPFSDVSSAGFLEYVDFIQRRLPFRLSAAHWKRWHINKRGDAFVGRRIIFALPRPHVAHAEP